jgi:hypothetical protein
MQQQHKVKNRVPKSDRDTLLGTISISNDWGIYTRRSARITHEQKWSEGTSKRSSTWIAIHINWVDIEIKLSHVQGRWKRYRVLNTFLIHAFISLTPNYVPCIFLYFGISFLSKLHDNKCKTALEYINI